MILDPLFQRFLVFFPDLSENLLDLYLLRNILSKILSLRSSGQIKKQEGNSLTRTY
jgi:hypothetical protein